MLNIITLLVAFTISGVAAYFSIFGLGLIFAGSFWSVIIMGIVLETGKITAVSWLYRNWTIANKFLRTYLTLAILILMLITSMGTFGFLARSHFDLASSISSGAISKVELIGTQISQKKETITDIDKRISLIDDSLRKLISTGKAQTSLRLGDSERKNRNALVAQRDKANVELNDLLTQKSVIDNEVKRQALEVGPIKYIAQLFFNSSDDDTLEKAVRILILIITVVFDPLAVSLVIAANNGLNLTSNPKNRNIINIDKSSIKNME